MSTFTPNQVYEYVNIIRCENGRMKMHIRSSAPNSLDGGRTVYFASFAALETNISRLFRADNIYLVRNLFVNAWPQIAVQLTAQCNRRVVWCHRHQGYRLFRGRPWPVLLALSLWCTIVCIIFRHAISWLRWMPQFWCSGMLDFFVFDIRETHPQGAFD